MKNLEKQIQSLEVSIAKGNKLLVQAEACRSEQLKLVRQLQRMIKSRQKQVNLVGLSHTSESPLVETSIRRRTNLKASIKSLDVFKKRLVEKIKSEVNTLNALKSKKGNKL